MNKFYVFLFFIFFSFLPASSETIKLKEKFYTTDKNIFLYDLIENNNNFFNLKNIEVKKIIEFPDKITSEEIIKILLNNNILNVAIIGKNCIIYNPTDKTEIANKIDTYFTPITNLENHLFSFVNNKNISLKIKLIKTEPQINLENIKTDYYWDFSKANYNINEIQKLYKLPIFISNKKYIVYFKIELLCGVWIANKALFKNDFFNKDGFIYKVINLSKGKKINSLVFDIKHAINTKFINNINIGEILYWDNLKNIPLIQKGELTKLIFKKNNFEIILPCTALNDGYENEKIKVRLVNGRELFGKLRKEASGVDYVEL